MKLENTFIYLIGFPGVGKLTIAKVLSDLTGAKLVDNHLINNPIFNVIGADGITPIPKPAWDRVQAIREIVFDAIASIASSSFSFILTNVLFDKPDDRAVFLQVAALADARKARLVPVLLECAEQELLRRAATPSRSASLKDTNMKAAKDRLRNQELLTIEHRHLLRLDTTDLPAESSARAILSHIASLD
ncbi:MAG TPA: hypothetical protein VEH07_10430 [Alphaproteobacteria bacterium]|nr:hypothetical protein [Alphaproteobacteria bacterium]